MYHANMDAFRIGSILQLSILAETQRHLDHLACNHDIAKTLMVPDGSRPIFDTAAKLVGLTSLSYEMDDLVREVAKEQNGHLALTAEPSLAASRAAIESVFVPSS
jgi:hypothetical protein